MAKNKSYLLNVESDTFSKWERYAKARGLHISELIRLAVDVQIKRDKGAKKNDRKRTA